MEMQTTNEGEDCDLAMNVSGTMPTCLHFKLKNGGLLADSSTLSEAALSVLFQALMNARGVWGASYADSMMRNDEVDWMGFRYRVESFHSESGWVVHRIEKVAHERVVDDDGNTAYFYFSDAPPVKLPPRYKGNWGVY